ncbi:hypothetical protein BKE30_06850 [Alkanindiges hydrocarboniclasticus]|uniref:Uncharacterized protein n=1 Tax=Alkanindiges hydrocarboniclasticus TaxID=1907941 RepID=A0A1S8CVG0_9GAMM|nr:hypothetical protein BKE30_06850 [Alkanindiges hydrocarboniclasticus]
MLFCKLCLNNADFARHCSWVVNAKYKPACFCESNYWFFCSVLVTLAISTNGIFSQLILCRLCNNSAKAYRTLCCAGKWAANTVQGVSIGAAKSSSGLAFNADSRPDFLTNSAQ